jgi:hypothetical protein
VKRCRLAVDHRRAVHAASKRGALARSAAPTVRQWRRRDEMKLAIGHRFAGLGGLRPRLASPLRRLVYQG